MPFLAAVSIMEANKDPYFPTSMTLMGGPIDTRRNPTGVNELAEQKGIDWFRNNVITKCRSRIRDSCVMSIRASFSSPAS